MQEVVGWPATEADYRKAAHLIPDDLVRSLMAVGTTKECQDKVAEYIDAGVTCPILYPMMDDIKPVIDAFAHWMPDGEWPTHLWGSGSHRRLLSPGT